MAMDHHFSGEVVILEMSWLQEQPLFYELSRISSLDLIQRGLVPSCLVDSLVCGSTMKKVIGSCFVESYASPNDKFDASFDLAIS